MWRPLLQAALAKKSVSHAFLFNGSIRGHLSTSCVHQMAEMNDDDFFPDEKDVASLPKPKEIIIKSHRTNFKVGYLDIGPTDGSIFVACLGILGNVHHLRPLYSPLTDAGIRMLVPEFPDCGLTSIEDPSAYDQSTVARATFITDFLTALGIHKADIIAGHSAGGFTALYLAARTSIFRSMVHLSCLGLTPHRGVRPYWGLRQYAKLLRSPVTSSLAEKLLPFAYRNLGGLTISGTSGLKTGILTIDTFDFPLINQCVQEVCRKRLPCLFTSSKRDKMCEWPLNLQLAKACGLKDENITYYDLEENIVSGPPKENKEYPRGIFFEGGGHFIFNSHPEIVAQSIIDLVRHLKHSR